MENLLKTLEKTQKIKATVTLCQTLTKILFPKLSFLYL